MRRATSRRPMTRATAAMVLAVALVVPACAGTTTVVTAPVAGQAPFPECQTDAFAFTGEMSLAAIGLDQIAGLQEANRVGTIWVTAGPVALPGPNGGVEMSPGRVLCVEWPDGSGMATTIDDAWQPPGVELAQVVEPAWPLIGIGAVILVLVAGSFVAFRRT